MIPIFSLFSQEGQRGDRDNHKSTKDSSFWQKEEQRPAEDPLRVFWEKQENNGQWSPYQAETCQQLEKAYQTGRLQYIKVHEGQHLYQVHVTRGYAMFETNLANYQQRAVRRRLFEANNKGSSPSRCTLF